MSVSLNHLGFFPSTERLQSPVIGPAHSQSRGKGMPEGVERDALYFSPPACGPKGTPDRTAGFAILSCKHIFTELLGLESFQCLQQPRIDRRSSEIVPIRLEPSKHVIG